VTEVTEESRKQFLKQLPNKLTIGRIAVIPVLLILYPLDIDVLNIFCAALFAIASFTDFLDGYLARKYDSVSALGALLDPIADKMLAASCLLLLAYAKTIFPLMAGLLICRDIAINGIRLVSLKYNYDIVVSEVGKWKTGFLGVAILCLLINRPVFDLPINLIGMITLWIGLGLSLYSGWEYAQSFLRFHNNRKKSL